MHSFKIRNFLKRISDYVPQCMRGCFSPSTIVYLLAFVGILMMMLTIDERITYDKPVVRYLLLATDCMLLLAPYLFLNNRWRLTVIPVLWIVCAMLVISDSYLMWFGVVPNAEVIWGTNPFQGTVIGNFHFNGLARKTIWVCIGFSSAIALFGVWMWRHRSRRLSCRFKTGYIITALGLIILCHALSIGVVKKCLQEHTDKNPTTKDAVTAMYTQVFAMTNYEYITLGGFTFHIKYLGRAIADCFSDKKITAEQNRRIDEFIASTPIPENSYPPHKGNVVLLVVESLDATFFTDSVAASGCHTPVLDSLLAEPSTFSALNVVPQIARGVSSDGQLIYNTGLLPLRNSIFSLNYASDDSLPSLPRILQSARSAEVMWENPSSWNHYLTTECYGYDELHHLDYGCRLDGSKTYQSCDRAVFDLGLSVADSLPQPFFMLMSTFSMHSPFDDPFVLATPFAAIDSMPGEPDYTRRYLRMLEAFDSALGYFIDGLKRSGLYENTMIFIASDHHICINPSPHYSDIEPIMFVALNAPVSGSIDAPVAQADVFPTILHLTGRIHSSPWRGTGISMLDSVNHRATVVDVYGDVHGDANPEAVDRGRKQWDVSRDIIVHDWFRRYRNAEK